MEYIYVDNIFGGTDLVIELKMSYVTKSYIEALRSWKKMHIPLGCFRTVNLVYLALTKCLGARNIFVENARSETGAD